MNCSNCGDNVLSNQGLNVCLGQEGESVARLCDVCVADVLTMKIVLSRSSNKKPFGFEGYLPVSSVK